MNLLDELAVKYGTDKFGKHHYTQVYYDLFKDRRETVKKVLEIGPAEGAGLFMFRDFFPNATIYGAEIDQKRVDKLQGLDRIKVFKCDQSIGNNTRYVLAEIGFDIDIVIDDGSHRPSDQIFTCLTAMEWLHKGVIYIIEDVDEQTVNDLDLLNQYAVTVLSVGSRYDDRLVIVRHKNE